MSDPYLYAAVNYTDFHYAPLSEITSEIPTVAMFIIINTRNMSQSKIVGTFMIYLRIIFQTPCSNRSFVIVIKPKAKYRFHAAVKW